MPQLSLLDLLFCVGPASLKYLWYNIKK
jgi:hypothetical protein